MPTTRLLIEYDGTDFRGWQIQPEGPTVQGAIEDALAVALRHPVAVVGSGRTDTGVHARGQVAHFVTEAAVDAFRLKASLNGLLPPSIAVLAVAPAPDGFHARYDARRRRYVYHAATEPRALDRRTRVHLWPAPDVDAMNEAARRLVGRHDFSSFCRTKSETTNRVCTVRLARWGPGARPGDFDFEVEADRFLHGMVRGIVGTLVEVGRGRRSPSDVADVLAARDRRAAGPAAPPHGLVLDRVEYDAPPA
ncbi:tRNA pseudouridine(38-40) synthase TruA [Rubrivirga marina]|uniref:tRNA pseudouridine synthase A n=1 Tax=Rubrivirga marina TaxID=1196024 RepID=A0A271IYY3_9BACT|nr:tRNA pseudouridine(38-40) synthase TruA [Rubrivirga marina]PAP76178.1 tRNA pseudouridine(38-40) synthase TruA [Rubrivirga marina]